MEKIKINNCHQCPFCNYFMDAGRYDGCNFPGNNVDEDFKMPNDKVHEDCPLKGKITVMSFEV